MRRQRGSKWQVVLSTDFLCQQMEYTLNCIVLGEASVFPVKINNAQLVGELKKAIKNKKPNDFNDVDADQVTLHQIRIVIPDDDDEYNKIMNGISQPGYVFDPKRTLIPTYKISRYFGQGPEGDIHILVELPKGKSIHCGGVVLMADVVVQMQTHPTILLRRFHLFRGRTMI